MIRNLVRKPRTKVVCDVYTCRNLAEFEVGHEVQRASCMHYCRECMEEIVRGTGIIPSENISENKLETDNNIVTSEDDMKKGSSVSEEESAVEKEESEPKTAAETYRCKHCGMEFPKPDGLKEYRIHAMNCAKIK